MPSPAANVPSTVIPGMRYRDCLAAIEWLCNVDQFCRYTSSIIIIWGLPTFQTWAPAR